MEIEQYNNGINDELIDQCLNQYHGTAADLIASGLNRFAGRFNVISLNARSVKSLRKFEQLLELVDRFENLIDVWAISETNFDSNSDIYEIPGYDSVLCSRGGRGGGGIVVYIRQGIKYSIVERTDSFYGFVDLRIEFSNSSIKSINLLTYYRPPNTNVKDFLDILEETLISCAAKPVLIVGDFNLDVFSRRTDNGVA
jgi:exonuclease III